MGHVGTTELLLIAAIVLLLFGGKRIPELMRGVGEGIRSFKEGVLVHHEPHSPQDAHHGPSAGSGPHTNG